MSWEEALYFLFYGSIFFEGRDSHIFMLQTFFILGEGGPGASVGKMLLDLLSQCIPGTLIAQERQWRVVDPADASFATHHFIPVHTWDVDSPGTTVACR